MYTRGQTDISWTAYRLFCDGLSTMQITELMIELGYGGSKPLTEARIYNALAKAREQFYGQASKPAVESASRLEPELPNGRTES